MDTGNMNKTTTICIVNYKTEELTRLCLRSIRKFTDEPYEIIVVDNDSADSSLEYLRSLKWIKLIERPGQVCKSGSWAHGTALDIGLKNTSSDFFVAMHSDTIVRKKGWLNLLADPAESDSRIACVGSGKLEVKPAWRVFLKNATDFKKWIRKYLNPEKERFYIRTICALYRTDILKKENLAFSMNVDEGMTCGKQLYFDLLRKGYGTAPLSPNLMLQYIYHLKHATMVLNPEFEVKKKTELKIRREMLKLFESDLIKDLRNNSSLDK